MAWNVAHRRWLPWVVCLTIYLQTCAAWSQQPPPFTGQNNGFAPNGISAPSAPNNPASFGQPVGNNVPPPNNFGPPSNADAGGAPVQNGAPMQAGAPVAGGDPNATYVANSASNPANGQHQGTSDAVFLEGGQIIARVGDQIIVAGDVLPRVTQIIKDEVAKIPPEQLAQMPPGALDQAKKGLMQRELLALLETKLLFGDAKRNIPKDNFPKVLEKLGEQFDKSELPKLYEESKTTNRMELDQKFVLQGSSLMQQKRAFSERLLASEWLRQQIKLNKEIHYDEMLAYYREHLADYEFTAKAKFEELMVKFDAFPNKGAAYSALAGMGNQILGGAPWADLAKAHSQGPTAREGGQYDWVSRGSLVLPILNEAVFTLPVGQLSQIIESPNGFHIIRVKERVDAGRTPFEDAQAEIRKKLQRVDTDRQIKEYLGRLRRETRVWTIFDGAVHAPDPAANQQPGANEQQTARN